MNALPFFGMTNTWVWLVVIGSVIGVGMKLLFIYLSMRRLSHALQGRSAARPGARRPRTRDEVTAQMARWGMLCGALCIIGGVVLFLAGVRESNTHASGPGFSVENAAPGTILFLVGFGIIHLTRLRHDKT